METSQLKPEYEGKLVWVHGTAVSGENLSDPLGINVPQGIALFRKMEMYQWEEYEEESNKDSFHDVEYRKVWSEYPIDSSRFYLRQHENPKHFPIKSQDYYASMVSLGDFAFLPEWFDDEDFKKPITSLPQNERFQISDGMYYLGAKNVLSHISDARLFSEIGDIRISYQYVPSPLEISVLAQQKNGSLLPYSYKGRTYYKIVNGKVSANKILSLWLGENALILAGCGALVIFILYLIWGQIQKKDKTLGLKME